MAYININDLIKDLIDGYQGATPLSVDDFSGDTLSGLEGKVPDFWKTLLAFMKNETTQIGHTPILESDFPIDFQSVYKYISENCDLNGDAIFSQLKEQFLDPENGIDLTAASGMGNNSKDYFWNESLSRALAIFLSYFDPDFSSDNASGQIAARDIYYANAGHSFKGTPWVKPNINVDRKTYDEVRGSDKIEPVLNSNNELQFTHDQYNTPWIRLLMPKYLRKVEVEDLNRNFWVISQVLGAICAYLFDDDAPFKDLFKSILSELVQLWENILYLWATVALISQKKLYTKIHTEIIPISNDEWQSYIKFDNIKAPDLDYSTSAGLEGLYSRVKYLIDDYPECHLCIIPVVRDINYKHNFYASEFYPGFIFYNRNKGALSYLPFLNQNGKKQICIDAKNDTISKYKDITGSLMENEMTYTYIFPTALLDNGYTDPYYLLLRTIPHITVSYDETEGIVINSFSISVHDISALLYPDAARPSLIETFRKKTDTTSPDFEVWSSREAELAHSITIEHWILEKDDPSIEEDETLEPVYFPIEKGFYKGEFPSYLYPLLAPSYTINVQQVTLEPLASPFDDIKDLASSTSPVDYEAAIATALQHIEANLPNTVDKNDVMNNVSVGIAPAEEANLRAMFDSNGDIKVLKEYALTHNTSTADVRKFNIYAATRYCSLNAYTPDFTNIGFDFWEIEDGNLEQKDFPENNKVHYQSAASNIGCGAVLYNPVLDNFTEYIDYKSWGYLAQTLIDEGGRAGGNSQSFTYLNDVIKIMNPTNWYIKFVQVLTAVKPKSKFLDFISGERTSDTGGHEADQVNVRIATHIFGPEVNGTPFYACKIYDRYETISANQDEETADLHNWTVKYINKSNFEYFDSIRNNLLVLSTDKRDYEFYPNTGRAATEKEVSNFTEIS